MHHYRIAKDHVRDGCHETELITVAPARDAARNQSNENGSMVAWELWKSSTELGYFLLMRRSGMGWPRVVSCDPRATRSYSSASHSSPAVWWFIAGTHGTSILDRADRQRLAPPVDKLIGYPVRRAGLFLRAKVLLRHTRICGREL